MKDEEHPQESSCLRENVAGHSACQRGCRRISWLEQRTFLLHRPWSWLETWPLMLSMFICWPLADLLRVQGRTEPMLQRATQEGSRQYHAGSGGGDKRICLWTCFVTQEKTEISALNQISDKSTDDVWGAGACCISCQHLHCLGHPCVKLA